MMGSKKFILSTIVAASLAQLAWGQGPEMAAVVSKPVSRTVTLPGEIQPFLSVALRSKVAGYVERVLVDRGSAVKEGDLLVQLFVLGFHAAYYLIFRLSDGLPAEAVPREPRVEQDLVTGRRVLLRIHVRRGDGDHAALVLVERQRAITMYADPVGAPERVAGVRLRACVRWRAGDQHGRCVGKTAKCG